MSWLSSAWKDLTGSSITQTVQNVLPVVGSGVLGGSIANSPWVAAGSALVAGEQSTGASTDSILANLGRVLMGGSVPGAIGTANQSGIGSSLIKGVGTVATMLGVGGALTATVGIIRAVGGRIIGWVLPSGARISRAAAVKLAKEVGLTAAAAAIGASAADLAEAILQHEKRTTHRRRGITAASMRTTRRTIGQVERLHHQLARLAASAHHRRAPARQIVIERKR